MNDESVLRHTIHTAELGTIQASILDEDTVYVKNDGLFKINGIPYNLDGEFRLAQKYGYVDGHWQETSEWVVWATGYKPIRRHDGDWVFLTPTAKAQQKIEEVLSRHLVPLMLAARESGAAARERIRAIIRGVERDIEKAEDNIRRERGRIQGYRLEIERLEQELTA